MSRMKPLSPPYDDDIAKQLSLMMPPGVPPIGLFRTFVHNLPMAKALGSWLGYGLSKKLSLTLRDRELLINRTCARCTCEYEWGVHVAFFAERVELSDAQLASLTHGVHTDEYWNDSCWDSARDQLLLRAADELHDNATLSDQLWQEMAALFSDAQILDILVTCGGYHAISFAANGAGVALEPGAPRFSDYDLPPSDQ